MIAALGALGALAAFSVLASEMSRPLAWPLALMAAGCGAWLVRRELRRPMRLLVWPIDGTPLLDGLALQDAQLQWRGPLAFLRWRDGEGHLQHLVWWPDTLPQQARRELRLAAATGASTPAAASMAP